jgi:hypothetical protein
MRRKSKPACGELEGKKTRRMKLAASPCSSERDMTGIAAARASWSSGFVQTMSRNTAFGPARPKQESLE